MSPTAIGVLLVVVSTMVEGFGQTFLKRSALDVARRHRWILLGVAVLRLLRFARNDIEVRSGGRPCGARRRVVNQAP